MKILSVDRKQLVDLVPNKHLFLYKYSRVSTVITNISVDDLELKLIYFAGFLQLCQVAIKDYVTINCEEPLDFLHFCIY